MLPNRTPNADPVAETGLGSTELPLDGNAGQFRDYDHMWHHGWGWHPGMCLAPFVLLLALIGTAALITWLVRCVGDGRYHQGLYGSQQDAIGWHDRGRVALDILEEYT